MLISTGTVTVTATKAADNTYGEAIASYILTINPQAPNIFSIQSNS